MRMSTEKKMAEERRKARVPAKVPLTEINEYLMCQLCIGYLIDATAIIECQHTFCKSCILKYLETNSYCPICEVQLNEAKPHLSLRSDEILQKLVYKLVPSLVSTEVRRRVEFVGKLGSAEESSGKSPVEIQVIKETEDGCYLSPDDPVSLSLEYFKSAEPDEESSKAGEEAAKKNTCSDKANDRRYLKCPAAVSVGLLKKFIRMKYGLSDDYRVDLLYNGDRDNNLENDLTLLDLSFMYKWKKEEPMRFHYRIYERPLKSVTTRPGIKRPAPAVLDDPPPDDDPAPGPPSRSTSMNSPTKHPRLASSSSSTAASASNTSGSTSTSASAGKGTTKSAAPAPPILRTRSSTGPEEAEMSSSSSCKSPDRKMTTSTSCSSSSESPASPLKISIRTEGKHHHHHHRHRHHKEKHKRKSKSKSKDRDKDKPPKDKDRYKYNAHPNPTQSQTISVKPGKHHHHHHHHHRHGSSSSTGTGGSPVGPKAPESINVGVGNGNGSLGVVPVVQAVQKNPSTANQAPAKVLERRPSSSSIQVKPIAIPAKPSPVVKAKPGKASANLSLPDTVHLQVPKSVTLIPVTPGGKITNNRAEPTKRNSLSGNSHTFTHPITNKSLHQITVTEVPPPPKTASPSTTPSSSSANNSNNSITIEKCSPNPTSHLNLPTNKQFNGPGSMEITKIYCEKGSAGSSGVKSVFETQQGKKLKGLDISISPSSMSINSNKGMGVGRKLEELSTPFPPKMNLSNLPKIPGVSILPQALHNAAKQQRNFNQGLSMSLSCTKLNENSVPRDGSKLGSQRKPNEAAAEANGRGSSSYETLGMRIPSPPNKEKPIPSTRSSVDLRPKPSAAPSKPVTPKRPFEAAFQGNPNTKSRRDSTNSNSGSGSVQPPPEKKRTASTEQHGDSPLDLSGRSSRSPTPVQPPSSASPKPKGHKNSQNSSAAQHTQTILSIAQNLAQKQHQQNQQRAAKAGSSPPSIPMPNPSPPNPFNPLGNLMTLSNAASRLHKMNQQHAQQMSLQNSPLNSLVAAATAAGYGSGNSPPISPGNGVGLPPGLLQHFNHHHHLNAMNQLMSPPGGKGPLDAGLFSNLAAAAAAAGLNGRMSGYGHGPGGSLSPPLMQNPYFNQGPMHHSRPSLRIPTVTPKMSHSASPKMSPAASNLYNSLKIAKPAKVNGSSVSTFVAPTSIIPISKSQPSAYSSSAATSVKNGGIPNSMKISNFLPPKSTAGSSNPNTNATITSSITALGKFLNMNSESIHCSSNMKSSALSSPSKSVTKHAVSSLLQSKAPEEPKPEKPISPPQSKSPERLITPNSETSDSRKNSIKEQIMDSRLGALGAALGLIPRDPPILPITHHIPTSQPNQITPQQQNQALRTIPNPSLLSSRQAVPIKPTPIVPAPKKAQAIELNMKLWIDRHGGWKDGRNSGPHTATLTASVDTEPDVSVKEESKMPVIRTKPESVKAEPKPKSLSTIVNGLKQERASKILAAEEILTLTASHALAVENAGKVEQKVDLKPESKQVSVEVAVEKISESIIPQDQVNSQTLEKSDDLESDDMDVDVESIDRSQPMIGTQEPEINDKSQTEPEVTKLEEAEAVPAPQIELQLIQEIDNSVEMEESVNKVNSAESEPVEMEKLVENGEVRVAEELGVVPVLEKCEETSKIEPEILESEKSATVQIVEQSADEILKTDKLVEISVSEENHDISVPEILDSESTLIIHEVKESENVKSPEIPEAQVLPQIQTIPESPESPERFTKSPSPEPLQSVLPTEQASSRIWDTFPYIITEEDSLGENSPALIIAEPEENGITEPEYPEPENEQVPAIVISAPDAEADKPEPEHVLPAIVISAQVPVPAIVISEPDTQIPAEPEAQAISPVVNTLGGGLENPSRRVLAEGPPSPVPIGSPASAVKKMENLEKVAAGLHTKASATNYNNNTLITTNCEVTTETSVHAPVTAAATPPTITNA